MGCSAARIAPASCAGGRRRADDEIGRRLIAALAHRQVHLVAGFLLERQVADVADDADDAALLGAAAEDVFANRILAGPQAPRHGLVDHHDGLAGWRVAGRDVAAGAQAECPSPPDSRR